MSLLSDYAFGINDAEVDRQARAIRKANRKARKAAKRNHAPQEAKPSKRDDYSGGVFPAICVAAVIFAVPTGGLSLLYIPIHGILASIQRDS